MLRTMGLIMGVSVVMGLVTDDLKVFFGCLAISGAAWLFIRSQEVLRTRLANPRLKQFKPYQLKLLALSLHKEEYERPRLKPMDRKRPPALRVGRSQRK